MNPLERIQDEPGDRRQLDVAGSMKLKHEAAAHLVAQRAVLFAEKLITEILAPVPHRHWTFSIPRVLRGLVERDRKLLGLLSQTAYASILKTFQALFDRTDVRPPAVSSL